MFTASFYNKSRFRDFHHVYIYISVYSPRRCRVLCIIISEKMVMRTNLQTVETREIRVYKYIILLCSVQIQITFKLLLDPKRNDE